MFPTRTKSRRGDASRYGPAKAPSLGERIRKAQAWLPLAVGVGFFVLATAILVVGGEPFTYRLGQTIRGQQILARVPIHNPEKLRNLQEVEKLNTPNRYRLNEAVLKKIQAMLTNLLEKASANETLDELKEALAKQGEQWNLNERAFRELRALATERGTTRFRQAMTQMLNEAKTEPLVRQLTREDRWPPSAAQYIILQLERPEAVSNDQRKYVSNPEHVENVARRLASFFPLPLQTALAAKWQETLQPDPDSRRFEPIWQFDKEATLAQIKQAADSVSVDKAAKPAGSPICEPGIIDKHALESLLLEHNAFHEAARNQEGLWTWSSRRAIGLAGIVLFITIGLGGYTWWFGADFVTDIRRLLGIAGVMLVMLLLARLAATAFWPMELAVVPVVMTGAILTIAFDQRFAFGTTSSLAVLITLAVGGGIGLFVILMASTGVTVFTLKDIKTRSKVLDVGGLTAVAVFAATAFVGLLDQQIPRFIGRCALTAAGSGLAAGFIIFGILPLIERIFNVATALTLLEWGSMHQSLLRRLREEAPGTYIHSQTLGDLAERAADAIGADGLLARTGAYYHDVGKLVKPNYFVENYEMRVDQHKKLQPTMSMLIIVGHVRDGLELARQYGLPPALRSFIAEHHGTTLVEYFYREAAARLTAEGKPEPRESEFRYPGPKPQSKETAILMLCDAVEGAIRAMTEPTAGRIEAKVHQIAMNRLMDGQLDECSMTLEDLRRVEDSLTRSLIALYHGRIAYPKSKEEPGEHAEAKPKQASSAG